ncbi:Periplasmic dipeptide transport protein [compost metagenome]
MKQAKATNDHARRVALYQQAQQLLARQLPISPIAHSTVYQPMRKSVHGFLISPFGRNSFYGVSNQP